MNHTRIAAYEPNEIPPKYRGAWEELKNEYKNEYTG